MHEIDLPRWAVARGASPQRIRGTRARGDRRSINVDMQNVFVAEGQVFANPNARDIVEDGQRPRRAPCARSARPVIWTRQTHTSGGPLRAGVMAIRPRRSRRSRRASTALQAGRLGHQPPPSHGRRGPSDIVVDKYRYGALSCPAGNLARALERLGAEMVVITGTLTNCCCETTAREANMAGYKVIVVSDATAALTDAEHNAALLNLRLNFADVRRAKRGDRQ